MNERGYLTTEQFNATDYNFPYTASISSAVAGTPKPDYYNVLYLPLKDTPGYGTQIISNVNVPGRLFLRQSATNGIWTPWISLATTTKPDEHDLPLAAGKVGVEHNSFRKWQNGRVALFVAIQRADGAELSGIESAFTLPKECRPYRHEVRRIDLSGADGNPAGYAHLHIYPDGNANIAGIVTSSLCHLNNRI